MSLAQELLQAFADFEARLIAWAQATDDVRALYLIGSRARTNQPADAWSDMDVILLVTDPGPFVGSTGWLDALGEVQLTFLEQTASGGIERRVLFTGGVDVDFVPIPAGIVHQPSPEFRETLGQLRRQGLRRVLDKDGIDSLLDQIAPPAEASAPKLTSLTYYTLVPDFWYHCVWVAKKLRRGEVLTALGGMGYLIHRCLLPMARYHAVLMYGPDHNTWHGERFFEDWADPRVVQAFRGCFPRYDAADIWQALNACMMLFSWLAQETGERAGLSYPAHGEAAARAFVDRCKTSA